MMARSVSLGRAIVLKGQLYMNPRWVTKGQNTGLRFAFFLYLSILSVRKNAESPERPVSRDRARPQERGHQSLIRTQRA